MLTVKENRVKLLNTIPYTRVSIIVSDELGKRVDSICENFQDGKETQKDAWIVNKVGIFKQEYPAYTISTSDLLSQIAQLQKQVATLSQASK